MEKKSDTKKHEKAESKKVEKKESATDRAMKPTGRHANVAARTSQVRRYRA